MKQVRDHEREPFTKGDALVVVLFLVATAAIWTLIIYSMATAVQR